MNLRAIEALNPLSLTSKNGPFLVPTTPVLDLGLRADGYPLVPVLFYRWGEAGIDLNRVREDLQFLASQGHTALSADDFLAFIRMETAVPEGAVLLAFEPGTKAVDFKAIVPFLLRQVGAGLLFVDPAVVGTPGALTWDEVRAFAEMGFEPALVPGSGRSLSAPQLKESLVGYARRVKKRISSSSEHLARGAGVKVRFAAYPDGVGNSMMAAVMALLKIQGVFRDGGEGNPFFCDAFSLERMDAGQRGWDVPLARCLDTFRKAELAW